MRRKDSITIGVSRIMIKEQRTRTKDKDSIMIKEQRTRTKDTPTPTYKGGASGKTLPPLLRRGG